MLSAYVIAGLPQLLQIQVGSGLNTAGVQVVPSSWGSYLAHVSLEALIVPQNLCGFLITATKLAGKFINVCLGDLLVQVSVVLVQVVKVLASQLLCIIQITSLVVNLSPAYRIRKAYADQYS